MCIGGQGIVGETELALEWQGVPLMQILLRGGAHLHWR
jgi:hypothetical protein